VTLRQHAALLKAVWGDPRTPWAAKALLAGMGAYLASPIDLIPDFVPVLGYLDDLVVVLLALSLAWFLVPREVWREHRQRIQSGGSIGETDA
jgi:uncharacterized membrane protein YkvA (DUF1232 family)